MGTDRKPLSLTDIRKLQLNSTIWDAKVTGFDARRQRSAAVAYILFSGPRRGGIGS
jgi:hypothetical protein